jgi:hypothetical protein
MLRFYFNSEVEPFKYGEENYKVKEVPELLRELSREFGLAYEAHDTSKMSYGELRRLYSLAAHWASTSFSPVTVYEIFKGYDHRGEYFGGQVPALFVCFKGDEEPRYVFPHKLRIRFYEKAISIYHYLRALKDSLSIQAPPWASPFEIREELDKILEHEQVIGYSGRVAIDKDQKKTVTVYIKGIEVAQQLPHVIKGFNVRYVDIM